MEATSMVAGGRFGGICVAVSEYEGNTTCKGEALECAPSQSGTERLSQSLNVARGLPSIPLTHRFRWHLPASRRKICFGTFEVDLQTEELRKDGLKVKVYRQS